MNLKHAELQTTAINWLYTRGCQIFAKEVPYNGETVDAIGMRPTDYRHIAFDIYAIEAKASRSDLICFKQKCSYRASVERPAVDFYYLIVADGVAVEAALYPMWGVLSQDGVVLRKAKRIIPPVAAHEIRARLPHAIAHVLVYKVFGKMYAPNGVLNGPK